LATPRSAAYPFANHFIQSLQKGEAMIVITGATGQLGRLVVPALLKRVPAQDVAVAVRNPDKANELAALGVQVRRGDYTRPESWDAALKGADKLLLISSSEVGQRAKQHRTVIDAAKRAGVKLLAYTSILRADTSILGLAGEHKETEVAIKASGIPFVFLRNGWYTENYTAGLKNVLSMGAVYGCAGSGRISSATRADFAEAAAAVLASEGQAGKTYELAGDTGFALSEYATEISRQTGKTIGYVNLSEPEYKAALIKVGVPEGFAALLADSEAGVAKGALFDESHQLSKLIGRPTTPLSVSIKAAL
jgi:NAD(P)H dehydrogenase (quinone)